MKKINQVARTFAKAASIAGFGFGAVLLTQTAYCDSAPVENIVTRFLPGWSWDSNWDKKDPFFRAVTGRFATGKAKKQEQMEFIDKVTPKAPRNLILIRHGQYNLKAEHDQGKRLTELGRRQAEATGKRLKILGRTYDRFIVSNMTRALETAEIIGKELQLGLETNDLLFESDPLLREGSPIEPSPPSRTFHPELHYYTDGARIEAAFRKYFHRAEPEQENESYEIIVCHANVIRYFCCRALQFPANRWLRISLGNGSITHVKIFPDGEVVLMSLGDNSHLSKDLLTTT